MFWKLYVWYNVTFDFWFQFYGMIERNKLASAMLESSSMTIFAPTNAAFQKFKNGVKDDNLLFYHMS